MIKELEDHHWFPSLLRRFQSQYIGSLAAWLKLYEPMIPVLQEMISDCRPVLIQDLCSGSGLPAVYIGHRMKGVDKTILTDKYPDLSFVDTPQTAYLRGTADVLMLTPQPSTLYTMYNSFHHFSDHEQRSLVQKMMQAGSGFCFAEILEPRFFTLIRILFASTILQVFTAPFVKPFSLARLFFTYVIPVNILTVLYDGIISVMKSKTAGQYHQLLANIAEGDYAITVNSYASWKGPVIYIKGVSVQ